MTEYRLYRIRDNRIYADVRINADADVSAIEQSVALLAGEAGELWSGNRRVTEWRATR